MAVKLRELTNADPDFYPTLGPFLGRHEVHNAIGGVPWDEDTKTWLVAEDNGQVVGFGAINQKKRTLLESMYTEHDDVRARLVRAAVERYGHDRDLHTTVRTEHTPIYTRLGFVPVKTTRNFTTLVRAATIRKGSRG